MCFLFDFEIKDCLNVIGVVASLVCAFYAFKTFEQAEKIAKIQDQKEKDKEANRLLNEIVKFFLQKYILKLAYDEAMCADYERNGWGVECIKQLKNESESVKLEYLLNQYKKLQPNITEDEEKTINNINKKLVLYNFDTMRLVPMWNNGSKEAKEEVSTYINNFSLRQEVPKNMNLDYKILEHIYNNIFLCQLKN